MHMAPVQLLDPNQNKTMNFYIDHNIKDRELWAHPSTSREAGERHGTQAYFADEVQRPRKEEGVVREGLTGPATC